MEDGGETMIDCARRYNERFPDRPPLTYGNGMLVGCWMIGSCYVNPNPLYGAYPHGYLERVHAMFPLKLYPKVLHVFSGGLTLENATAVAGGLIDGSRIELVDIHGPQTGRYPTWQGNVHALPWRDEFDLALADPPYTAEDAAKYGCRPLNRRETMHSLRRVMKPKGILIWLDQVWPMHSKAEWKTVGTIGLVRSTNHRVRLVTIFEAQ